MTVPVREFTAENIRELPDFYRSINAATYAPRPLFKPRPAPVVAIKPEPEPVIGLYALPFWYPPDGTYSRPEFIKAVFRTICEHYEVTRAELEGHRRSSNISIARHVMMYLLSRKYGWSLPRIGRALGNRDHTTGLHAVRKVKRMMAEDEAFRSGVEKISTLMPKGVDE